MTDVKITNVLTVLAPKFRAAVEGALKECNERGVDAVVFESLRSNETQQEYYKRGVTKAKTAEAGWHGYGLAVDVISKKHGWDVYPERNSKGKLVGGDPEWYKVVVEVFKSHGLDWGGDWQSIFDAPHWQWGKCRSTPGPTSRNLFRKGKYKDVWPLVGAD
jgi:peptidoglycan L-alanyl-D-glutamate endopeptidase CwlK